VKTEYKNMATENLQNHFIPKIFILNFSFLPNFANKRKAGTSTSPPLTRVHLALHQAQG
jgi:hypothetical protein